MSKDKIWWTKRERSRVIQELIFYLFIFLIGELNEWPVAAWGMRGKIAQDGGFEELWLINWMCFCVLCKLQIKNGVGF